MNIKLILAAVSRYWKYIACLLVMAILFDGAWKYGQRRYQEGYERGVAASAWKVTHLRNMVAKMEKDADLVAKAREEQAYKASLAYNTLQERLRNVERDKNVVIKQIIKEPVYSNECFSADGLRQLNRAIQGK